MTGQVPGACGQGSKWVSKRVKKGGQQQLQAGADRKCGGLAGSFGGIMECGCPFSPQPAHVEQKETFSVTTCYFWDSRCAGTSVSLVMGKEVPGSVIESCQPPPSPLQVYSPVLLVHWDKQVTGCGVLCMEHLSECHLPASAHLQTALRDA